MQDQYAVIGHPVSHSRSPWIHSEFALQLAEPLVYSLLDAKPDAFEQTVQQFREQGGRGLNVTVPFKQEAWAMVDQLSDHAQLAGAVNTLSFLSDGTVRGDNTDGVGLVRDLMQHQGVTLANKRVLILGAGGAVRGVIQPILEQTPSTLHIVNRTPEKALELAKVFADYGEVSAGGYDELATLGAYDVIINGTASSLGGELPPLVASILAEHCHAYDMMYAPEPTVFERWCQEQGAGSVSNGLGMLVEQAAESFYIWRGVRPNTAEILRRLKAEIAA